MPSSQEPHFQSKCLSPLRLRPLLESYFYKARELFPPPQFHNLTSEFTFLTGKTGGLHHSTQQPCLSRDGNSNDTKWDWTSTVRKGVFGSTSSKMFIWTSGRTSSSYRHDEKRNIYQKIRDHDLLDKRKTVTALKAGEDRAILLGLTMMVCSIMMYFLLGITLLRSYMQSVWTEESQCTLLNASITETFNCSFSCGPDCLKLSQYPCLQVYVNLTSSGEKLLLYHTEETMKINQKCSYIPKCGKNFEESMSLVSVVMENFRKYQHFSCYSDPEGNQKSVILTKLYSSNVLFHSLFWPTCMMAGGVVIVAMVKLTQYLSLLCDRIQRINR
ncbi:Calcium-activated potassium channel subunit beta-2 [Myotis brandtii]|uniref:Calcium-activated potassium channel subunit beta-2 n=3 Tax=Vespertilionidae TaxID=9431 RepID=S7Q476_MYOBR|nr:Calcium-activated potassium channel subunit beta-2 [Myotis brandtii]